MGLLPLVSTCPSAWPESLSHPHPARRLALYVYEYLLHVGAQKSAQTFLSEVSWPGHTPGSSSPSFHRCSSGGIGCPLLMALRTEGWGGSGPMAGIQAPICPSTAPVLTLLSAPSSHSLVHWSCPVFSA